jgi:large subunit ribosomal protein L24
MSSRLSFHVRKGDTVTVVSGNHKGASGKVLAVLPKKQQVLVEGVRIIKKHMRKSQDSPNGAIIEREGPIHVSNVKLVEKRETKGKE